MSIVQSLTQNSKLKQVQSVRSSATIALVGNPNSGKTTLFNGLTGLNAKTSNFPGTTVEHHIGRINTFDQQINVLDLPGLYSLEAVTLEEQQAKAALLGQIKGLPEPNLIVLILDATNLERNLFLTSQIIELRKPTVIALNMVDIATKCGIKINSKKLQEQLHCPVVQIVARRGKGIDQLIQKIEEILTSIDPHTPTLPAPKCCSCNGCPYAARYDWAEQVGSECATAPLEAHGRRTERIDQILTHPIVGLLCFLGVMATMFVLIFALAEYPMHWIEKGLTLTGGIIGYLTPAGDLQSLLIDGIIGGAGSILAFLPQITILFLFITLLEDTGYLARAAFVMDRLMRRVGLPGKAFIPMLSAHACAVPGIMATRVIEDKRDRLITILILPLMTCSARLPVYAMVTALLFPNRPIQAGLLFTAVYALGIAAALIMSFIFKHTILPGEVRPLIIELPHYRLPCLRTACITALRQATVFIKKAGTIILLIAVVLWIISHYPKPPQNTDVASHESVTGQNTSLTETNSHSKQADDQLEYSLAGRFGKAIEPIFAPLGFNWQINVGIISSFAAREVLVSTLAIVYGDVEEFSTNQMSLTEVLRTQRRNDGSLVFNTATSYSLLVFYVFAMQCLPTQIITKRETGQWRWAAFQFGYMSVLAYIAALLTYQTISWLGIG